MKTISHLYGVLMAVFGVSFGRAFAKNYSKKMDYLVDKYIGYLFWVSAGIMVVYYYFYYVAGVIEYFGFDSELPLVIAFFLGLNKRFYTLVSILLLFFSGKRSPLISSLVMVLLLWNKNFRILSAQELHYCCYNWINGCWWGLVCLSTRFPMAVRKLTFG